MFSSISFYIVCKRSKFLGTSIWRTQFNILSEEKSFSFIFKTVMAASPKTALFVDKTISILAPLHTISFIRSILLVHTVWTSGGDNGAVGARRVNEYVHLLWGWIPGMAAPVASRNSVGPQVTSCCSGLSPFTWWHLSEPYWSEIFVLFSSFLLFEFKKL